MLPPRRVLRFVVVLVLASAAVVGLLHLRQGSITGPFSLEASEQWIVRQDQPGEIVARYTSGRREIVQSLQVYQFPRGDMIRFNIASNLEEGVRVAAGTPIMECLSMTDEAMEPMFVTRTNRLTTEVAMLQRETDLAQAERATTNLYLASKELEAYQKLIARRKQLVDQGILSRDELDLMEIEYSRRKIAAAAAQSDAEYRHVQTRPETASLTLASLEEAVQELNLVKQRRAARWLTTPIAGRLTRFSGMPQILLRVVNDHDLTARVVVPVSFADQLKPGDPIELVFASMGLPSVTSTIQRIEINPVPMLGQSAVHLLVPVSNTDGTLGVALTGQAMVRSVHVSPFSALWWRLRLAGFDSLFKKSEAQ